MTSPFKALLVAVVTSLATSAAVAQVKVDNAWVRATVPHQQATGAFMSLSSAKDARLVGVSSSALPNAEIHEMRMENDVMKMRQITGLDLPAGQTVELKPGGYHIMFMGLPGQVKEGVVIPLTLEIENSDGSKESVEVQAPVRALTSSGPSHTPAHSNHAK